MRLQSPTIRTIGPAGSIPSLSILIVKINSLCMITPPMNVSLLAMQIIGHHKMTYVTEINDMNISPPDSFIFLLFIPCVFNF